MGMALIKSKTKQPELDVNNGIFRIDQIQFDERTGAPTDSDLVDGRLYHLQGTGLESREGGAWVSIGAGSGATTFTGLTDTPANYSGAGDQILKVNTGATAVEFVAVSGDVTMSDTGVFSFAATVIVDADINASAAIAYSKLAALTDANILVGNGSNVATVVAVSGDVTLANTGAMTVTDLTLTSEAEGTVAYFNGTNWVILAVGTNGQFLKTQGAASPPVWDTVTSGIASALASPFTIEGGTFDPSFTVTAQTSSAAAVTIPDLAGVAQELVFSTQAVTLANKTLTTPIIVTTGAITDAGGDAYLTFVEDATPRDSFQMTTGDAGVGAKLEVITADTNANFILDAAGTGDIQIANGTELTFLRATQNALIVVADQTGEAHTFNIPDIATGASDTFVFLAEAQTLTNKTLTAPVIATIVNSGTTTLFTDTDTIVGKATTDTLTNKTMDADGTGNVLTNINADELDPANFGGVAYGIPFLVHSDVSNAATTTIYSANFPFKARLIDAWVVNTGGAAGTWKLDDGTSDITTAVNYSSDTSITRASSIDDAKHTLLANATLRCINSDSADDAILYALFMRID